MAITSATRDWGTSAPNIVRIVTTNTLAECAASGYVDTQADELRALNSGTWEWFETDLIAVAASDGDQFFRFLNGDFSTWEQLPGGNGEVTLPVVSGDFAVFDGTLGALEDLGYSPSDATKTKVVMAGSAVQVGYIAHFVDTAGTIDDTAGAVINAGNIQAGLSGTAGTLISFPATAANGSLIISALNAGGAFNTTIRNSVMGQSSVVSIPDPGAATANFILDTSSAGQSIAGGLTVSTGNLIVTAGNITSGSSGDAGTFISFPATAANGTLILAAANAGGAFNTTISNSTMGQSTVYSIPDVSAATGQFLVKTAALVNGNLVQASGTGGVCVDSGVATSNVQLKTQVKAAQTADIGGAGAGPINVVVAGVTAASVIVASIVSSSNTVAVAKVAPGAGSFDITFTGDPGAACVVSYVAYIAAQ